ncbi:MG2 domain-containing protein [Vulgatibacter sp.]|uniref:alpha-2-macroglobulin family protein n=1 Tax=Vulgatibacter sp. TaxID=1971226 RepID=UPI0035628DAF
MKASGLRIAALLALLTAFSCTCGGEKPTAVEEEGRVLEPLPAAPSVQVDPEALPGADGALAVVVARPQGEAEGSFHPTITFSRPIVALQEVDGQQLQPAQIAPAVAGTWKWLGSTTAEFVPASQLPYATTFEVTVPAGLRALDGSTLGEPYRFSFSTPRPVVQTIHPPPGHRWLDTLPKFTLILNQPVADIDHAVSLHVVKTRAPLQLKVIEKVLVADELRANEKRRRFDRMEDDPFRNQQTRYVLQAEGPVPLDSDLRLVIDGSLRGSQGPLTLGETQTFPFRTYGPMRVEGVQKCMWNDGTCPWGPVVLRTSNEAEVEKLRGLLTVEPAVEIDWDRVERHLPSEWSSVRDPWVVLPGNWRPGTTYTLRVAAGLSDVFHQRAAAFEGTVRTDDREPFWNAGGEVALLESNGEASLPVETVNVPRIDVSLWRLEPAEMARLLASREAQPGAADRTFSVETAATPNRTKWTPIEVRKELGFSRSGLFAARIAAPRIPQRGPDRIIGQITDLAVHTKLGATSGAVWVTRLSTGSSVPGAELVLYDRTGTRKWQGRTDESGLARVPGLSELLPGEDRGYRWEAPFALVTAAKDGDLGAALSQWMDGLAPVAFDLPMEWEGNERKSLGLVFPERGIYRPGETVHTKGVVRFRRLGALHKPPEGTAVELLLRSPRGDEVAKRQVQVSRFGTFHADFAVPADAPLGTWLVEATASLEKGEMLRWGGDFRVEEYRAPQFQVDVRIPAEVAFTGDPLQAHVAARYLFGGAMSDAKVNWSVQRSTLDFTPPGNGGFVFGANTWWWDDERPQPSSEIVGGGSGSVDAKGAISLDLGKAEAPAGRSWQYTVEAEVADVNRQRVAARASIPVHPAALFAGTRVAGNGFAEVGKEVAIELVAVSPEGTRAEGAKIALELKRRSWQSIRKKGVGGHWYTESEPVEERVSGCEVRSTSTPQRCTFTPKEPGFYLLEATVTDAQGRTQTTRDSFYVVGGGWVSWQRGDTDRIDLVADRKIYEPGQTAKILVKSPYPEAEALVTVERAGVISAERIRLTGASTTIEVPITEASIPNVFVGVILARGRVDEGGIESGQDPGRPAVRVGYTELLVEKKARRLAVEVKPDAAEKRPRERVRVDLAVRGADGSGAQAELAVWAVDEAVLRLTGYEAPDLVAAIHPRQGLSVRIGEPLLHLVQRRLYGEKGQSPGGGGGDGSGAGFRSRFQTTVLFAPSVVTDAQGRAQVEFELPDNLTTWRILAVAVGADDRFGSGVAQVKVAKPLLALPALPRAVRVGDRFEAGVVLHGHRFEAPEVQVTAEAEGVRIEGPATQTVSVVQGRPREVRFLFVAEKEGTAVLRFAAQGGGERDGVEQRIPVKLPVAMEAVATYGDTTTETSEGLVPPKGARPDVGGLEITMASTALGGFDENFDQLVDYPYGCLEQMSSRLTPFVALRELSGRFGIPWKDAAGNWLDEQALRQWGSTDPDVVVAKTVKAIEQLQGHDGGYRYWASSPCSSHYASAYAVWALARAKEVGYAVDAQALARGQSFLADVVAAGQCEACGWGCNAPSDEVRVAALWTLARTGKARPSYFGALYRERKKLPLFAQAQLADAMFVGGGDRAQARQLLGEILNHAKESPGGVHFEETDPRTYAALWSTDTRTTAIVLGTLVAITPEHPFVAKIARWLGSARGEDGRYDTTQEAAFALTALTEVTRVKEAAVPDFTARVILGGDALVSQAFEGRSMRIEKAELPMSRLGGGGALTFRKEGEGVLYYAARLRYAPEEMPTRPLDRGLTVQRWFEPYEGGGQAKRFYAGELVRVRVRIASNQQRHYAAIEVPLPAGLEAVDTSLASTAALPRTQEEEGPGEGYEYESAEDLYGDRPPEDFGPWAERFYSPWSHTEIRDDRVLLFADQLPPGVHVASFVARATTPGRFVLPPVHAEEMYAPEVFGRSDGGLLEVIDAQPVAER